MTESSAPAAFVYVAEVTRERRNRSAGTHTRSPPDPFRAPAHHAPGNEHTSLPGADRIDVAPRAERCVCLPLRNDAVQSQARSRRCSFQLRTEPSPGAKSLITTTACVSVCARCLLPTMAHDCTWPQIDVRLETDVRLGKSPTLVFARVWVDASGHAVSVEAFRRPSRLWSRGEVLGSPSALPNAPEFAAGIFASHRQRCRPRHAFAATA